MALPPPSSESTCVVTGASSGIGAEIARVLAGRGRGVTLVARRASRLELLAEQLRTLGVRVEVLVADLVDPDDRAGLHGRVTELGLTPDVLVNNAGGSTTGPVHASDPESEVRMVRLDVEAVVDLTSRFLPGMVERGGGGVLNVASTAAFQPMPGQAGYAASKAFVLSYSEAVAGELRGTGVEVTTLCPGPVETEFGDAAGFTHQESSGALPAFMWEDAADVAEAAVAGLEKGRLVVIPGAANRIGSIAAQLTPRTLLLPILSRQHPAMKR